MRLLDTEMERWVDACVKEARRATCTRSRCGSVIVMDAVIIGKGHNSPPGDDESQRRCANGKEDYHPKVTDKTCCIHAEQRAIMDALRNNPGKLAGATLYFVRLDGKGEKSIAGKPYCTICSKMALDVGIKEFVLWHKEGIVAYGAEEYNDLSYAFRGGGEREDKEKKKRVHREQTVFVRSTSSS